MGLSYVELKLKDIDWKEAEGDFVFDETIPLPYRTESERRSGQEVTLDWEKVVEGILHIALSEPKHEHIAYYRSFLLAFEPDLPHLVKAHFKESCELGGWSEAEEKVQWLIFLLPGSLWPLLDQAYLYERRAGEAEILQEPKTAAEYWREAELVYKQLLFEEDLSPAAYFQLGYFYLQRMQFPQALETFLLCEKLTEESEDDPVWRNSQFWIRILYSVERLEDWDFEPLSRSLERGDWEAVLEYSESLILNCPESAPFWYLHAVALLRRGFFSRAGSAFARSRELGFQSPINWHLPYYLGLSSYLSGEWEGAETHFLEALSGHSEEPVLLYWLSLVYKELGEDRMGSQFEDLVEEFSPGFPDLLKRFRSSDGR